ncbi:MAG TPA: dynamin family protein [Smithellaceae bacterium]|nr:dynamin family protein [Smithellaceae bacterium]
MTSQNLISLPDIQNLLSLLERQLVAARDLLLEDPLIDVAVLGQFKAGKSSFLNSFLGHAVLPVGAIPVTTAITRIQYGAQERALVRHFNGRTTEVPLADIVEFTSEAKNPGNEKNVAIVDIELPTLQKYPGLRLVDTPGLGSVYKYHQLASENWLPSVGTALLAVSSDRPLSEHDLELIRELTSHTPNIIILLTKADLLSPEQQQEIISFFQQTLQRELHRTLPVYLYSTKIKTADYKQSIEQDIFQTICANRDAEFLRILRHKSRSLSQSTLSYLRIALHSSLQADLNRDSLHQQILNEKVNEDLMNEELGIISREHQRQTRPMIETYLEPFLVPLIKKVKAKLEQDMPSWQGNLWKLSRRYEAWVSETLSEEIRQLSKTEHVHFLGTLKKAHSSFSRSLEAFCKFLGDNIENVLGVKLAGVDWNLDVVEPDHPDIAFTKSFDVHLDLLWFLIPMFLFRGSFDRHFMTGVPKEVEINLSRLAYQWEKSVNNAIDAMRIQATSYIHEELATIEALLSRKQGQTDNIKQLIAQIEKLSDVLSK